MTRAAEVCRGIVGVLYGFGLGPSLDPLGNLHEHLQLLEVVTYGPDEQALDAGVAVGAEEVAAVLTGADGDAGPQLVGRAADERGDDIAEDALRLVSVVADECPGGAEAVREGGGVLPLRFKCFAQLLQRLGEAFGRRVVGRGEPAVGEARHAAETD